MAAMNKLRCIFGFLLVFLSLPNSYEYFSFFHQSFIYPTEAAQLI